MCARQSQRNRVSNTRAHTHLTACRSTHLLLEEKLYHLLHDGQQAAVVHSDAALEQGQDVLYLSEQRECRVCGNAAKDARAYWEGARCARTGMSWRSTSESSDMALSAHVGTRQGLSTDAQHTSRGWLIARHSQAAHAPYTICTVSFSSGLVKSSLSSALAYDCVGSVASIAALCGASFLTK